MRPLISPIRRSFKAVEDFLKLFYFAQTKVYFNRIWNGNAVGKEEDYKLNFFLEKQTSFGNQLNVDFQN